MPGTDSDDPRPLFRRALDQAERQACAVRPVEMDTPTPCADYDVRALLEHIVAVVTMLARIGAGSDPADGPEPADGRADDSWADAFRQARTDVERTWGDDAVLDRTVTLPWATLPGRAALEAYTHELTVHSWDLAQATGRLAQLDPDLAAGAFDWFASNVPPEARGGQVPFEPVVSVPDDADIYTRLAAYTGRRP